MIDHYAIPDAAVRAARNAKGNGRGSMRRALAAALPHLVAEERERCAKLCQDLSDRLFACKPDDVMLAGMGAAAILRDAIRAGSPAPAACYVCEDDPAKRPYCSRCAPAAREALFNEFLSCCADAGTSLEYARGFFNRIWLAAGVEAASRLGAAPVVWTDAQIKLFICYLTDDGLPSDSFFELRKEDIRAGVEAASRLGATKLCEDEGCPHHGTPHVCINVRERILEAARMFDALPEADRENLKAQLAWLSGNQRKED